ncbi:hypothetical protein D9M72_643160 [compost metagenome]
MSRSAAAMYSVDRPKEVPNSMMWRALVLRASWYSSTPVLRDTGSHRSLSRL